MRTRRAPCLGAALGAALLLAACVVPPSRDAATAREWLDKIQADPNVAANAPAALADARQAVAAAETEQPSAAEADHRAYIAELRVDIAAYTASANRDRTAYEQLAAHRDAMSHSSGSITTLATDALGLTPQKLEFHPIGANPSPAPATGLQVVKSQPPRPSVSVAAPAPKTLPTAVPERAQAGPLLVLAADAFAGGTALKPAARTQLDRIVPELLRNAQRPVLVCFGDIDSTGLERASAIRDYLVTHGVARQRLLVGAVGKARSVPRDGVLVDFE